MKFLLLGSNGQLGRELKLQLSSVGSVSAFTRSTLDITNTQAVHQAISHIRPDFIINAAAYTSVDRAEINKDYVFAVNSDSVANLAQLAKSEKIWLIHYSTDYVFDGTKLDFYNEKDFTNPINTYGASKLAGEKAITKSGCHHLIFRTSWVISKDGHNFAKTILRLAMERNHLKVVYDQIGVPTTPSLISKVTVDAIRAIQKKEAWPQGIYHLAPQGKSNWYEITQNFLTFAQAQEVSLSTTADNVQAIRTAEYTTIAKRPLNSLLDTQKLQSQLSFILPHWKEDFLLIANDIIKDLMKS